MKAGLQKVIEEVRNNAKCKKIMIIGSDKGVLKKIDNMKLENVNIFPTDLLSKSYVDFPNSDKIYILPNYEEEPLSYFKYEQ